MQFRLLNSSTEANSPLVIIPSFNNKVWPDWFTQAHKKIKHLPFEFKLGDQFLAFGLGEKKELTHEKLRREMAKLAKQLMGKYESVSINLDQLSDSLGKELAIVALVEGMSLATYEFTKHKLHSTPAKLTSINLFSTDKTKPSQKLQELLLSTVAVAQSISFARDLVNEAPNILHSEEFAERVTLDAKKLSGVKTVVLGKKELQKENMNLFLAVNAGSAFEPRLVHLTYTPKKSTKKTKHVAFVGKGLTFDTGGYCLKPAASIKNMKGDMAGAATVYAAFRALVLQKPDIKLSCFLAMTDNAISDTAILPDSVVKGRNKKSVEILNTDAEGRLVLADVVNYACDFKPDYLIDAATLTGACLVALGHEVCGLFSNSDKLANALLHSAEKVSERMWRLPLLPEHREDIKGSVADLKNIGSNGFGGALKGAVFIEEFLSEDVKWAHLDIAGIADSQGHLPYCPKHGPSGLIIRTLIDFAHHA